MASAISMYNAHMGTLPAALTDLTSAQTNGLNQTSGPFLGTVPVPPPGGSPAWGAAYTYTPNAGAGTFSVTATGDGTTVTVP
jgi:hypothetical protein